jgi:hypothetical protein
MKGDLEGREEMKDDFHYKISAIQDRTNAGQVEFKKKDNGHVTQAVKCITAMVKRQTREEFKYQLQVTHRNIGKARGKIKTTRRASWRPRGGTSSPSSLQWWPGPHEATET